MQKSNSKERFLFGTAVPIQSLAAYSSRLMIQHCFTASEKRRQTHQESRINLEIHTTFRIADGTQIKLEFQW